MVWNCEACKHPNIRESMQQCYKCHSVRQPTRGVDAAAKRKSNDSKDAIKAPPTKKPFRGSSSASPKNVASFGSAKRGLKGSSQVKIAPKANTASGSSGTAEKSCLSSFILKNPSAPSTQSTVASTRAKKPSLMPRKEKDMTQMSIKDMFFKPKSTDTTSEATKKAQRKKFLQQESPDPAATSTLQRVTEIQFLRDRLSIVPPSNVQPIKELPLNDEQLRAAIAPPDVPLSIRAGAGSGKTHTMVQRARYLVTNYQFDPEEILMITFSNRAANELKERIAAMFTSMYPSDDYPRLPTVKTFHGLAFNWVRMYWKACGLGRSPTILATESQQRSLMKIAIETHLNNLRLERCKRILWKARDLPEEITWDDVLARFQEKHKENHQEAVLKACKRVDEDVKNQSKSQALKAEIKAARKLYLREECYLSLMKMRGCDLKHKYDGTRLDNLRLEKCKRMLWDVKKWPEETSWDEVLKHIREEHKDIYKRAVSNANKRADKDAKKQPTPKTTEESQQIRELYLREECYIALLRKQDCDLKRRWIGDKNQCKLFLKLITKARRHNHNKNDYPQDDACVWELYEKLQRETGQLDFDVLLSVFTEEALQVENIRGRFHAMYSHVVVDEFQDNSELQAEMLRKIVKGGSLTVVGDDDQCIYQFRGASPGNFDRLRADFLDEKQVHVREETLVKNHRSSASILAAASTFLSGDTTRHPKELQPTKSAGIPVEIWKVHNYKDQARHIALAMIQRHEHDEVPYSEMACLFRCSKMGMCGNLTTHIQMELAEKNVPFHVLGGRTIFQREAVLDLLAYLQLCIGGCYNDDSFERVINKPPRRLPNDKIVPLIKEQIQRSGIKSTAMPLQEAAAKLCNTPFGITNAQVYALKSFLDQIRALSAGVHTKRLPDLLLDIWHKSGLEVYYQKKNDNAKKSLNGKNAVATKDEKHYMPLEILALSQLAKRHVEAWEQREQHVTSYYKSSTFEAQTFPSLFDLSKKVAIKNIQEYDLDDIPEHILDDLVLAPRSLGRSVIREFLACAALQSGDDDEETTNSNKVSISTVHKAKGLEWSDVYVPYFNERFLPTKYREESDDDPIPKRHKSGCSAREGDRCNQKCSEWFRKFDDERLGSTADERHLNEERRLGYVAATRAKEKLVFCQLISREVPSRFAEGLNAVSSVITVEKGGSLPC